MCPHATYVSSQAPEVAVAIATTLRQTDCPKQAAEAGWEAVWPKHRSQKKKKRKINKYKDQKKQAGEAGWEAVWPKHGSTKKNKKKRQKETDRRGGL